MRRGDSQGVLAPEFGGDIHAIFGKFGVEGADCVKDR